MGTTVIIGVLFLALGVVALTFQGITFFTHERVVDAGPFTIDVAKPYTLFFTPLSGSLRWSRARS